MTDEMVTIPVEVPREMAEGRAVFLRSRGCTPEEMRRDDSLHGLFDAALLEAIPEPPKPLVVGDLAMTNGGEIVLVIALDGDLAWGRHTNGGRANVQDLTYHGPRPEGWGDREHAEPEPEVEPAEDHRPPSIADGTVDKALVEWLRTLGKTYGPQGVAAAAAELAEADQ